MKGPSNNDRERLGKRLKLREAWAETFGWMVGAGLVIEYGKEIVDCVVNWHPPSLALLGGVVVTAGVFGEVVFSRLVVKTSDEISQLADSDVAQANRSAAEALESARKAEQATAEANLARAKLEGQLAWRTITDEERKSLVEQLSRFAGQRISLSEWPVTDETAMFRHLVASVLNESGWKWKFEMLAGPPALTRGFSVLSGHASSEAATALYEALSPIGRGGAAMIGASRDPDPRIHLIIQERFGVFPESMIPI